MKSTIIQGSKKILDHVLSLRCSNYLKCVILEIISVKGWCGGYHGGYHCGLSRKVLGVRVGSPQLLVVGSWVTPAVSWGCVRRDPAGVCLLKADQDCSSLPVRPKLNVKPSVMKPAVQLKPAQKRRGAERSAVAAVKPLNSSTAPEQETVCSSTTPHSPRLTASLWDVKLAHIFRILHKHSLKCLGKAKHYLYWFTLIFCARKLT